MLNVKSLTTKAVVSMVAVGSLAATGAGVAAATAPDGARSPRPTVAPGQQEVCKSFRAHVEMDLAREAQQVVETTKLRGLADEARQVGHITRATWYDRQVVRRNNRLSVEEHRLLERRTAFALRNADHHRTC